jgi:hypothetical protein
MLVLHNPIRHNNLRKLVKSARRIALYGITSRRFTQGVKWWQEVERSKEKVQ